MRKTTTSVGTGAAAGFAALTLVYLLALLTTMARGLPFPPPAPYSTIFHLVNLLVPIMAVPLWVAMHLAAPPAKQALTLTSLLFVTLCALLVPTNRFVALTMVAQSEDLGRTAGLEWFQPYGWPSLMFSFELLGWGVFFSLACLFQALAFRSPDPTPRPSTDRPLRSHGTRPARLEQMIAVTFTITGLVGLIGGAGGLLIGSTDLMGLVAPVAWGLGPVTAAVLVLVWLRRGDLSRSSDRPLEQQAA